MNRTSEIIVFLPGAGYWASLGLDGDDLAAEVESWDRVGRVIAAEPRELETAAAEAASNGNKVVLVGRDPGGFELGAEGVVRADLCCWLPWLGGSSDQNARHLIRAAVNQAALAPSAQKILFEPIQTVLVQGSGPEAAQAARAAAKAGFQSLWVSGLAPEREKVTLSLVPGGNNCSISWT